MADVELMLRRVDGVHSTGAVGIVMAFMRHLHTAGHIGPSLVAFTERHDAPPLSRAAGDVSIVGGPGSEATLVAVVATFTTL